MPPRLTKVRLLDVRSRPAAQAAPIADSVNIPYGELPGRVQELPPRDEVVRVAATGSEADLAVAWLRAHGRQAAVSADDLINPPGTPPRGRLWSPCAWLEAVAPKLRVGRACELACGTGRDAVYLASLGWRVTAIDILPDALERGARLAANSGIAAGAIDWVLLDLERDARVPLPGAPFDLITMTRYLHRPLVRRMVEFLAPGGAFVAETFTTEHRARHGKPSRDTHVLEVDAWPRLCAGLRVVEHDAAWRGEIHSAHVWAVRD